MPDFGGRVVMLGYGAVAQCTLPLVLKHLGVPPDRVTVIDFENRVKVLRPYTAQGVSFVRQRITKKNMGAKLEEYLALGDLLIDLAWNIDCCELLDWCHRRGVLYINTSVEVWDPYAGASRKHPTERTLYWRHMKVRALTASWSELGPTAILEHGANPGLISHWTKQGLLDLAEALLADGQLPDAQGEQVGGHAADRNFNLLAQAMGVKVIHCSERDTQRTEQSKEVDEFVNTWSIEGFREEGTTTAELGWGTHERELPPLAFQHTEGPRNQICLARMGMNVEIRSWVPYHTIYGMLVRHGEAFTLSDWLTVWEGETAVYRPTVHYAYCPCDAAIASLHELRGRNYTLQPKLRILADDISDGADILGALIMGHPFHAWWTGSILDIETAREHVPGQNATTVQVAVSTIAAVLWMLENPQRGVCSPEDLPHDFVLGIAGPYLGQNVSVRSDWTPLAGRSNAFAGFNGEACDKADPWQFKNFLVDE